MTKDERFLLELYRKLTANHSKTCDPQTVALALGYNERLMRNILKGLIQANLVKHYSPQEVGLTERGRDVAHALCT